MPSRFPFDSTFARRDFLSIVACATLGVTVSHRTRAHAAAAPKELSFDTSVITVFMRGGMSHIDTFDPKPGREEQGPNGVVRTNIAGIVFGQGLERLAAMADRLAILRSVSTTTADHVSGWYIARTSYRPTNLIRHPSFGSNFLRETGYDGDIPGFVLIGNANTHPGSGFLDSTYAPASIVDPESALPAGISEIDFYKRLLLSTHVDAALRARYDDPLVKSYDRMYARAVRLLGSSGIEAFDLKKEPQSMHELYGASAFSKGCLLARRLVESGVRVVDIDFDGWDTHNAMYGPSDFPSRVQQFDRGLSALLGDLEERGLLDTTLVAVVTEFGRSPRINANRGRDHHPAVFSCLLAGAGVKRGVVHGASDESGFYPDDGSVSLPDVNATCAAAAGYPYEREFHAPNGRPFKIGGEGRPVSDVLA